MRHTRLLVLATGFCPSFAICTPPQGASLPLEINICRLPCWRWLRCLCCGHATPCSPVTRSGFHAAVGRRDGGADSQTAPAALAWLRFPARLPAAAEQQPAAIRAAGRDARPRQARTAPLVHRPC